VSIAHPAQDGMSDRERKAKKLEPQGRARDNFFARLLVSDESFVGTLVPAALALPQPIPFEPG
jgi:hypothetical protein